MEAILQSRYGSSRVLEVKEVEKPSPKTNEVLVKVRAVAINDYDWSMMRGKPYIYRLMFGLLKPKSKTPGMEISGEIVKCGEFAHQFKIGDAVHGDLSNYGFGGFSEYLCVNQNSLTLMPSGMSFEDAASLPHASTLALQGLVDVGGIKNNEKILINGAGGGVGTLGVNIAKLYDTQVTGVDSGSKLQLLKSAGYDHVVDYQLEDFTKQRESYDLILDTKTNRSIFKYLKVLSPEGRYVTVGGSLIRLIQLLLLKTVISPFTSKSISIVNLKTNKDLEYINSLYQSGKLKPVLDRRNGLREVPDAVEYFGAGKHKGKVVITL